MFSSLNLVRQIVKSHEPSDPRPLTASTSVTAQLPTERQRVKSPAEAENSAEQKAPPASAAGAATRPQPSEFATTSTPQPSTHSSADPTRRPCAIGHHPAAHR